MKKKNIFENLIFLILYLITQVYIYDYIENFYKEQKNSLINRTITSVQQQYESSRNSLVELANSTFEGYVNRVEIKQAFANQDREKLYDLLKDRYEYLKSLGFVQVHFHTSDNKSFLRLHSPQKFGDDLSNFRETVVYVNTNKKSIHKIETGRILPGLRNVYPLFLNDKYIGSVELSFGMEKLEGYIKNIYSTYTHFLFDKKEFYDVVFKEDQHHFKISNENPNFVERDYTVENVNPYLIGNYKFKSEYIKKIDEGIKTKATFAFELAFGDKHNNFKVHNHYVIVFIPIHEVKEKKSIYFVFYEPSDELKFIEEEKLGKHIFFTLILTFLFLIIYLAYKYNKNINQEREKFESILDNSTDFIHILDKKGNVVLCSQSFANILGYTKEEALKLNIKDWNATQEVKDKNYIKNKMSKNNTYQTLHKKKDGTIFPVHATAKPIALDGKNYYYVSSRDITTLIKYDEIKKQKVLYDAVFEGSIDAILLYNLDNKKIVSCNQKCVEIFKADSKEMIINTSSIDFLPEFQEDGTSSIELLKQCNEIAIKEGHYSFNFQYKRLNNEIFWVYISLIYLRLEDENLLYVIIKDIQNDILKEEENKKYELLMMEQSRLAQMGEMISMIAHQWRQPLNEITIKIQKINYDYKNGLVNEEYLKNVVSASKRIINYMSETIDNFRSFYKVDKTKNSFDVKTSLEDTIKLIIGNIENSSINLNLNLQENLIANGYESELKQIILILVNNAIDAMNTSEKKDLIIELEKRNGDINIFIKDSGSGIPDDIKNRIFEPYFTTKHSSIGTGIGLYTAKMILERSFNGKLTFESDKYGTIFKVTFPS